MAFTAATLHILCFEESSDCTLEHIARSAGAGDAVLVLGPTAFAQRLQSMGLASTISVRTCNRVGGMWRWSRVGQALESEGACDTGARLRLTYGPLAQRICDEFGRNDISEPNAASPYSRATVPLELPASVEWPQTQIARVRSELGLAPHEAAMLVTGEPSDWVDLSFASRAVAMARVGGANLRMVVSPNAVGIAKAQDFVAGASGGRGLIVDERAERPWEILPALDLAMMDHDGAEFAPVACRGRRSCMRSFAEAIVPQRMSPLPALWALACATPVVLHESIELGAHRAHPLVTLFGADVAVLARSIHAIAVAPRATSASAASR